MSSSNMTGSPSLPEYFEADDMLRSFLRLGISCPVAGDPTGESLGVPYCDREEMSFSPLAASMIDRTPSDDASIKAGSLVTTGEATVAKELALIARGVPMTLDSIAEEVPQSFFMSSVVPVAFLRRFAPTRMLPESSR